MATLRGLKKRALRLKARAAPTHRVPLADGSSILVDLRDEGGLQLAVWGSGRIQPLAIDAWHRLLNVQRWNLVIDVGANYGEFAIPATRSGAGSVLAVEPNTKVCGLLLESLRRFGGDGTVCCAAVAGDVGVGTLAVGGNSREGRLTDRVGAGLSELILAATTLDELAIGRMGRGGSLLAKIDVEGGEVDAIRGASELLRHAGPVVVLIETVHSGVEPIIASVPEFEAWGFDTETGRPMRLVDGDPANASAVNVRDILLARGVDIPAIFDGDGPAPADRLGTS